MENDHYRFKVHNYHTIAIHSQRKFWSQTSDNMDGWKSGGGKSQRREEKRREERRSEKRKSQKKEDAGGRKGGKVANHCVFSNELSPEGRTVGSLQRRVRSHLARWEVKNCTQLWREAHVEVKMYKTPQLRSTFRSWNVEKVHAIVARSTFPSQKCPKTHGPGPLLDVQMSCRVAGARDFAPCQKWGKNRGFVAISKMLAGVVLLKRTCKDAFRVAGAAGMLGGQAADFLREIAFWCVRLSGLLRWFCVTGAALRMIWHHWFVAGAIL